MIIDKGVFLMVFDQLTFTLLVRQMSRKFTEGVCNKFLNKHAQHIYTTWQRETFHSAKARLPDILGCIFTEGKITSTAPKRGQL